MVAKYIEITRIIAMKNLVLQKPTSPADWEAYHAIRFQQIHQRYCPEALYDPQDPEEALNLPLVLKEEGQELVLGTIRIDMLPNNEASFRWIAIHPQYVGHGFGRKMIELAESYIISQKRSCIRIPATQQSLAFANRLGFSEEPWAAMPQEACMIAVAKHLIAK